MNGRHRHRSIRSTGLRHHGDWRLKWYQVTVDEQPVSPAIETAAIAVLDMSIEAVPDGEQGLGFAILHYGAESVWLLVDYWTGDVIRQHLWAAALSNPTRFKRVNPGGPTACVWELEVIWHERNAFVDHILDPADGPDVDGYLSDTLTIRPREVPSPPAQRWDLLIAFHDAWHRGDIDGLMELMTDEPAYRASAGAGPGTDYVGAAAVRAGFAAVIDAEAPAGDGVVDNAPHPDIRLTIDGALSFWTFDATSPDGEPTTFEGVDVWTFDGSRIASKNAYRKAYEHRLPVSG